MEKEQIYLNEKEYNNYKDSIIKLKNKLENTTILNNLEKVNQLKKELNDLLDMESRIIIVKDVKEKGTASINKIVTVAVKYGTEEDVEEETFKLVASNKPNLFGTPKEVSISSLMGQHCLKKKVNDTDSYMINNVFVTFVVLRVETENQYKKRMEKESKVLIKK